MILEKKNFSLFFIYFFIFILSLFFGFFLLSSIKLLIFNQDQSIILNVKTIYEKFLNARIFSALMTNLWLFIFLIISIFPIGIFISLYIHFFIFNNQDFNNSCKILSFRAFYLKFIIFFSKIPEFIVSILLFSSFVLFFNLEKDSIIFFALGLIIILLPMIIKILLRILNSEKDDFRNKRLLGIFKENENSIECLLFKILPKISQDIILLLLKIFVLLSSFGLILLSFNDFSFFSNENFFIPKSFSDNGESLLSQLYIFLIKNDSLGHQEFQTLLEKILIFSFILFFCNFFIYILKKLFITKKVTE